MQLGDHGDHDHGELDWNWPPTYIVTNAGFIASFEHCGQGSGLAGLAAA